MTIIFRVIGVYFMDEKKKKKNFYKNIKSFPQEMPNEYQLGLLASKKKSSISLDLQIGSTTFRRTTNGRTDKWSKGNLVGYRHLIEQIYTRLQLLPITLLKHLFKDQYFAHNLRYISKILMPIYIFPLKQSVITPFHTSL